MRGYLHVNTGNGKGKTTAALGQAIRAAGAGLRVLFVQFIKDMKYSEIGLLERLEDIIEVKQFGNGCFVNRAPDCSDEETAREGLVWLKEAIKSGRYGLVILDEANIALQYGLYSPGDLLEAIEDRQNVCDVVITGRYAPYELIEAADVVTDMQEIKHYYHEGVTARTGIER